MTSAQSKKGFFEPAFLREIFTFAIPAIGERMLLVLSATIGTIFIARYLGAVDISAVSISSTYIGILRQTLLGLSIGASVSISRRLTLEKEKIGVFAMNAIWLCLGLSLIALILSLGWADGLLGFLFKNSEEAIRIRAIRYLHIIIPSMPFLAVDIAISAVLRGGKNAKTPFILTLISNLINLSLCYFFIVVKKSGIEGPANAFLISTVFGGVSRILYILSPKAGVVRITRLEKPCLYAMRELLKIGAPSMVADFFIQVAFLGIQSVTAMLGTSALAGYQLQNNILNLLYCVTGGLENAQVTFVGNKVGEMDKDDVRRYGQGIYVLSQIIMTFLAVVLFVFAVPLCSIFAKNDAKLLADSVFILRIMCFSVPLTTGYQAGQGMLKATGHAVITMLFHTFAPWCVRIPVAYVLVKYTNLGIYGLIIGLFSDYAVRAAVCTSCVFSRYWMKGLFNK